MKSERRSVVSDSLWPHELYIVLGILQARILEWVTVPFSRGSSQPRSPALQMDSLSAKPKGKPENTGVDSLFLLQWIFLAQELNPGLLQCRQIHYQLHYQGSPWVSINRIFFSRNVSDLSLKFMSIKLSVISFIILLLSVEFMLMSFHSFLILIINIFFNCPWSL